MLVQKEAQCGCEGCYYDTHDGCPSDEAMDKKLPTALWPCTVNGKSIIWVEQDDDARGETTTSE